MAINGVNSYNSRMRLTGLSGSGIDTDSIVSQLMKVQKLPLDKLGQKKQLAEWKRDAYRDITSTFRSFKNDFFDVLKPANNMLSQSTFKKFTTSATENGVASTVVSASGNADASAGTHTVLVKKIATADYAVGTAVTKPLISAAGTSIQDSDIAAMNGSKINMTVDGVTKTIQVGNYTTVDDLVTGLNSAIRTAFGQVGGVDKIKVSSQDVTDGGGTVIGKTLKFESNVATVNRITLSTADTTDTLSKLGFKSGDSNRLNIGYSLGQLASKFAQPLTFGAGTPDVVSSSDITVTGLKDKSFSMTVDGVTKAYTFTSDPSDVNDMAATLNTWANSSAGFGAGAVNITSVGGTKLSFSKGTSSYLTLNAGPLNEDALLQMNISAGSESTGLLKFSINSKEFTFKASQSLTSMLNTINSDADAKVNMKYDENSDTFSITAKQLGAGDNIEIGETVGNFFSGASTIGTGNPVTAANEGHDAEVEIDGVPLIRSSNTVNVNGINYTFLRESNVVQNVSLSSDVNSVFDNIKKFVDKYNEVIGTLNTKVSEDYDRDYLPLTDDQKNAMTSDDITKWETRAKTGLLKNDSIITNSLYNMRKALSDNVSGVDSSLTAIGITTGTYEEKGKLHIDETKLKNAIQNDPDSVMNLFTKKSTIEYSNSTQRSQRFSEEGLANRLNDIIQDNIRTSRDSNGNKGLLLEKAGMVGDASEYKNVLYDEIYEDTKRLVDLSSKLSAKENAYYAKFTAMESALSKMQAQSTSLISKLGG